MSVSLVDSRNLGASVQENVVAALNSMGAQPQGCYGATAPVPALALDFLTQTLDPRITFSRADGAGAATRVNSAGLIETVPVNLQKYSEDFTQAGWSVTPGVTKTSTNNSAPFGVTADAMLLTIAGTSSVHVIDSPVATYASGLPYTLSVYLKAGTTSAVQLSFGFTTFGGTQCANFALTGSGSVTLQTGGTATIFSVGGGWYRCTFTVTSTGAASDGFMIGFVNGPTMGRRAIYDATALTDSVYVWGAQVEQAASATAYIPTTSAASGAPRFDYDPVTLAPRGLLIEEARTNLLTYSDDFRNTAEAGAARPRGHTRSSATRGGDVGPDGTTNTTRLIEDATAGNTHYTNYTGSVSITANTAYTYTVMLKAGTRNFAAVELTESTAASGARVGVNLTTGAIGTPFSVGTGSSISADITNMGSGWWRVRLTCIVDAASVLAGTRVYSADSLLAAGFPAYNGDGTSYILAFGEQLEAGSFPTSYIPTTTAAVTRAADVASMTGTNFSSWFNATEGTFVADVLDFAVPSGTRRFIEANDDTSSNRIILGATSLTSTRLLVTAAGAPQADVTTTVVSGHVKVAASYGANSFSEASNGVLGTPDAAGTVPTVTKLWLGKDESATSPPYLNGHLQRITYYNKRLPDATLKALSA